MPTLLHGLGITKVDFVDRPADPHARMLVWKRDHSSTETDGIKPDAAATEKEGAMPDNPLTEEVREGLPEDVAKAIDDLKAERDALAEQVDTLTAAAEQGEPSPDDIEKADLPEPVRKRMDELEAQAREATEIAKREREMRETREWSDRIAKFDGVLPEDAPTKFRRLAEHDGDLANDILKALSALSEQVDESALFKSAGFDGTPAEGSAEAALDARAREIAKAEGIDEVEAFAKATSLHPDLYERYAAEKGA